MDEIVITYETLYELLRREKSRAELQVLDKEFFQRVTMYLKEKKQILESQKTKDSIFASSEIQKTKTQINNIKKILRELYERRESKIIQLALFSSRVDEKQNILPMLPEEQQMYENLMSILNNYRKNILFNVLSSNNPEIKVIKEDIKVNKEEVNTLIRFVYAVPKFIGEDLNIYGPFIEEDIAYLPKKIAELLIKKKRAEEIKIKE